MKEIEYHVSSRRLLLREITKVELNKRNKTLKIVNAKSGKTRVKIV